MTVSTGHEHYDALIQGLEGAVLVADAQGRCVAVNSAAEDLFGYDRARLTGKSLRELFSGTRDWLVEPRTCSPRGSIAGVPRIRTRSGQLLCVRVWASRMRAETGGATLVFLQPDLEHAGSIESLFDGESPAGIEALSHAQRSLRESEARFRGAFDASSIGMALVSHDGRFLQVNPALCRIVGYTEAELLATTTQAITHPDDVEVDRGLRAQLLAGEISTYQIEKTYICKTGATITGRLTASLVRGGDGEPLYFVAQVQDITQFKAFGVALREAEARYRTLVEQIPAAVYIDDAEALGRPVYVSPRIEQMLGYSPEGWVGDPDLWVRRLHPDDQDRVLAAVAAASSAGRPFILEYRLLARDGRVVWVHDEASLLLDDEGAPHCWHGMMIDITDRKLAEDELRAAKEAAEEASRLKSAILSVATHELRTPLTIISGYVELLAESAHAHLSPEERDYLEIAQNGAKTLATLVDDLLDLARIEAGRMDLVIRPVDAGEALERVRRIVDAQAAAKNLALDVSVDPGVPMIAADVNRLVQILLNIFGNAIKFTTEGSVQGVVRGVGGGVEIAVTDTGIGIPPEAVSRIFEEFRQEESGNTRRFGGTGIGLAIVRRLVELHHGTIAVQSEVGVGSRFALWFPAADPDQFDEDRVPPPMAAVSR